jgi:hypothetical protein
MERLGLQVANFLLWLIQTHNIPPIGGDHRSGGLVVMGWSLGNVTSLALLGQPDGVPIEAYQKLKDYLKKVIIYGQSP